MKLRQSRDRELFLRVRRVRVGEVDHEIDWNQLEAAPVATFDPVTVARCDFIYRRYVSSGGGGLIPRHLFCDLPVWVFLEYLADRCGVLLHGSPDGGRTELRAEGLSLNLIGWERPVHFAYRSSTEAIFAAVLDTAMLKRLDCLRKNSAVMMGADARRRFYFGLDYRALPHGPWTAGTVYLYRAADFPEDFEDKPFLSADPIRPLARVTVTPQDWPLLGRFAGLDLAANHVRTHDTFAGYPWRGDPEIHPHLGQKELADIIADHLAANLDRPVGLPALGKIVDASPVAALRMFRGQKGVTPHVYHLSLRLKKAKGQLRLGLPIAEAALECGFADQSHLTRQFRADLGLTPGQYLRAQESSIFSA